MKCSEIKVIKKDGTKEEFNVQKVLAAVNKSANRAMIIFSKARALPTIPAVCASSAPISRRSSWRSCSCWREVTEHA